MKIITFSSGIIGAALFIIASILGAAQIEGYSLVSQYISESYSSGLPNTSYLRYMYIGSGLLLAFFGFSTPSLFPKARGLKIGFLLFAIFYGFGTIVTGFFPCDLGCNPDPDKASLSQFIHNTMGFLTYIVVPFSLISIGLSTRRIMHLKKYANVSMLCGGLAFVFVVLLFGNPTGSFIGLIQRIIEGSILFWVMYTALYIRRLNSNP